MYARLSRTSGGSQTANSQTPIHYFRGYVTKEYSRRINKILAKLPSGTGEMSVTQPNSGGYLIHNFFMARKCV